MGCICILSKVILKNLNPIIINSLSTCVLCQVRVRATAKFNTGLFLKISLNKKIH